MNRNVVALSVCQGLVVANTITVFAVGGLAGSRLAPAKSLATLSITAYTVGAALSTDALFPDGANVGFVQIIDRGHVRLRVWERGAGATLACGTGACAAAAVLRRRGKVDASVAVELPGGTLQIDWPGEGHELAMTGPAEFVFEGVYDA